MGQTFDPPYGACIPTDAQNPLYIQETEVQRVWGSPSGCTATSQQSWDTNLPSTATSPHHFLLVLGPAEAQKGSRLSAQSYASQHPGMASSKECWEVTLGPGSGSLEFEASPPLPGCAA